MLAPWKKSYDQPRQYIKKQRHYFAIKGSSSQAMVFSVVRYGCDSWTIEKAECQRIDAFELWYWRRLLKSPLDSKEIQPVHPEGNQSWIFTGKTDAETPILWPSDVKSPLIGKDPDAGKDWEQEKGTTEDEMFGWHHWLDGHEFGKTLGDSEGQGRLESMGSQRVRHDWATEQYRYWLCKYKT